MNSVKVQDTKINIQKSVVIFYIMSELSDKETEKTIPFTIAFRKKKTLWNTFNQGGERSCREN